MLIDLVARMPWWACLVSGLVSPKCSSARMLRTARKGPDARAEFWGCTRLPACKGTATCDTKDRELKDSLDALTRECASLRWRS